MDYLLYSRVFAVILFAIALCTFRKYRRKLHFTQVVLFSLLLFVSVLASFVNTLAASALQFLALAAVAYSAYLYSTKGVLRRRKQLLEILENPKTPYGKELHKHVFYPELKNIEQDRVKLDKESKKVTEMKEAYTQRLDQLNNESKDFKLEKKDFLKEKSNVLKMQESLSKEKQVVEELKERLEEKETELEKKEKELQKEL